MKNILRYQWQWIAAIEAVALVAVIIFAVNNHGGTGHEPAIASTPSSQISRTQTPAASAGKKVSEPTPTAALENMQRPASFPCDYPLDTNVSVDLNGDGTEDIVRVQKIATDEPGYFGILLDINNQTVTKEAFWGTTDAFVIAQIGRHKVVIISAFTFSSENAYCCSFFTLDEGGRLVDCCRETDWGGILSWTSPENGRITFAGDSMQLWQHRDYYHAWSVSVTYVLTDGLRLIEIPPQDGLYQAQVHTGGPSGSLLNCSLTVFENRDTASKQITLDAGQTVTFDETDTKQWMKITAEDGRSGWARMKQNTDNFYNGGAWQSMYEIFNGLYQNRPTDP